MKTANPVPSPTTLGSLLQEFFKRHADKKLAPKTSECYREQAAYLSPVLCAMPLQEITPLCLSYEWDRLLESGGRHRKTKEARPLSAKMVRNITGVVSSAFVRAVRWGLATFNPVTDSEPPVPVKHQGVALTPAQQSLLIEAATGVWCLSAFLELSAATGARRGEVLALEWSDLQDGHVLIARSLSQTKAGLKFKGTKTGKQRLITLPPSAIAALESHRKQQDVFRDQFGPADYQGNLIFANPDGTPLKPDSISSSVSLLFRRLKLPKHASLHSLRHAHGSHLLATGTSLPAVSKRLGHSTPYVTATIYAHAIDSQDEEAARKWDEFQQRSTTPAKSV